MPCGSDPRGAMHVEPDVALLGPKRLPGVQPHSHPHQAFRERSLRVGSCRDRVGRTRKRHEERIALCVDLDPVGARPGIP